jgi:hypothetical protein
MEMAEDRNYPVLVACPHCENLNAKIMPPVGDRSDYRCPECGTFSICGTQEHLFEIGTNDPKQARFVEDDGRRWLIK